jgi:HPt (histidine-containing phosphotransfer) domain-containing protein
MSSINEAAKSTKLVSQLLLEDADLRDIVEEFVGGLESRLGELKEAHQKLDFEMLTTLAHRLKGAAGSYGYPEISRLCAAMEQKFASHQADAFATYWMELTGFAEAARAGLEVEA